jgi:DNA ligase-1
VFDILYKDGLSLLDTPLVERLKILEETIQVDDTLMRTASYPIQDAHTLTLLFDEAVSKGWKAWW